MTVEMHGVYHRNAFVYFQFPITALREIKILQLLKHENVVNLIQICTTKGNYITCNSDSSFFNKYVALSLCLKSITLLHISNPSTLKVLAMMGMQREMYNMYKKDTIWILSADDWKF